MSQSPRMRAVVLMREMDGGSDASQMLLDDMHITSEEKYVAQMKGQEVIKVVMSSTASQCKVRALISWANCAEDQPNQPTKSETLRDAKHHSHVAIKTEITKSILMMWLIMSVQFSPCATHALEEKKKSFNDNL